MYLEYVLAFTQVPIEMECYMKTPIGIEVQSDSDWVLKVKNNMYGQHQPGIVWNKPLVELKTSSAVKFMKSKVDKCVLDWGKVYI